MSRIPTIGSEAIVSLYEVAKKVYEGQLRRIDAIELLHQRGINKGTAQEYIYNFRYLMEGEAYERTTQNAALEYFLERITKDYGPAYLSKALHALQQHIVYYEGVRKTTRRLDRATLQKFTGQLQDDRNMYPDEIDETEEHYEGAAKKVSVNRYERDPLARQKCLDVYGCQCTVCGFDFEERFGEIGKQFIHVHHLVALFEIKKAYKVDPIHDLRPVCPNCHAMLHRRNPAYTIAEMQQILASVPGIVA